MSIITFNDIRGAEQTVDLSQEKFNVAFNADCMEFFRACPNHSFSWIVADPPYGDGSSQSVNVERERERRYNRFGGWFDRYKTVEPIRPEIRQIQASASGTDSRAEQPSSVINSYPPPELSEHGKSVERTGGTWAEKYGKKIVAWDVAPGKEVFDEIFRVSTDQCIFGGNYFSLPPTRCFLVWRKLSISESFSMAMAEYAWTSANMNAKVYECAPQGKANDPRFHPTAKPIDLYRWVYNTLCKPGDTILDPFLGSGSSRIAAYDAGLNFIGLEIDPYYFQKEEERFARHTDNYSLFD